MRYCVIDETTDRSTATDKKPLGDALSTNQREDQGLSPPWSDDFVSEELFGDSLAGLTVGARDAAPGAWGWAGDGLCGCVLPLYPRACRCWPRRQRGSKGPCNPGTTCTVGRHFPKPTGRHAHGSVAPLTVPV